MGKPEVLIFAPAEEKRALEAVLAEAEFDGFEPRVLAAGPGRERVRAAVREAATARPADGREMLLLIGVGPARPLAGGLAPGEAAASGAVVLTAGEERGRLLESPSPLVRAVMERLAGKGFRPGRLLEAEERSGPDPAGPLEAHEAGPLRGEDGGGVDPDASGCLAADSESAGLALAAADWPVEPAWLNLRLAPDGPGQTPEDFGEALSLKLLVALSTLDRTPPPSACSGCRNPCGLFNR